MKRGFVIVFTLSILLLFTAMKVELTPAQVKASNGYPVHNLNTGLNYTLIQEAIDAPETLDDHKIFVEDGTYWEHVVINKSLSIIGENRNTTIVDGNGTGTVVIISADNVSLTGFTIQGSNLFSQTSGIYASQWTIGSNISHNIIMNNQIGIEFDYYCSNNTLKDNIVVSNEYHGIKFEYFAFNNTVHRNTVSMNNGDGIMFWAGGGNNIIENNIVHSNQDYGIYHQKGDNIIIKGNWLHNNSNGIFMGDCSNSFVSNNNITAKDGGIFLSDGINIIVENNLVLNGHDGIGSGDCFNNTIIGNRIMHNVRYGLSIGWYCSNNTIEKNTILDNSIGISLARANNNTVLQNNVSQNDIGIHIEGAGNNTVLGNTISSSGMVALSLVTTSNNLLIHNNVVNNTRHVSGNNLISRWDNGLEGNFWSNYSGVDLNHDGIGDSPYLLEYGNQDNYPLMGAFHSFNISQDNNVNAISNSTIMDLEYFESNGSIRMHISNMTVNQTHGFVRICIPHDLMTEPYNITVDGVNPTYWNYTLKDNSTHRWIYFAYEHSTLEIVIIPEFPFLIEFPLFMILTLLAALVYRRRKW